MTDEQKAKLREPINWLSSNSRWIVIGPQTGRVTTIENGYVDLTAFINKYIGTFAPSTENIRTAQVLEAREFTPEMGVLGGR